MPLYKVINHSENTQVLVWKITESLAWLRANITLNTSSQSRIEQMKSDLHQKGFLSVRHLLKAANYSDFDLFYTPCGKPHLTDGTHISITHSHQFSAIILSQHNVGIDIEMQREKIIKIGPKFTTVENDFINKTDVNLYIQQLTQIWGMKEVIFKIENQPGISFKKHIQVAPFQASDTCTVTQLDFYCESRKYNMFFENFEEFSLVFGYLAHS
jgi:4'-phosphopantetheinyl transferase